MLLFWLVKAYSENIKRKYNQRRLVESLTCCFAVRAAFQWKAISLTNGRTLPLFARAATRKVCKL